MITVSVFKDFRLFYGVDYSRNPDCMMTFQISKEDFLKIKSGSHTLERLETDDWRKRLLVEHIQEPEIPEE